MSLNEKGTLGFCQRCVSKCFLSGTYLQSVTCFMPLCDSRKCLSFSWFISFSKRITGFRIGLIHAFNMSMNTFLSHWISVLFTWSNFYSCKIVSVSMVRWHENIFQWKCFFFIKKTSNLFWIQRITLLNADLKVQIGCLHLFVQRNQIIILPITILYYTPR